MWKSLAVLAVASTLLACGSETTATVQVSVSMAGTYKLNTVSGKNLPFTYQVGAATIVITSDVLTVADAGTWSERSAYTFTLNGQTTNEVGLDSGTWTLSGSTVTFNSAEGNNATYTGTVVASGFNLASRSTGFVMIFSK